MITPAPYPPNWKTISGNALAADTPSEWAAFGGSGTWLVEVACTGSLSTGTGGSDRVK
jgi:hypothetical protein